MLCCRSCISHSYRLFDCWFLDCQLHALGFGLLESYVLGSEDQDWDFLVSGLQSLGLGVLRFSMAGSFIHCLGLSVYVFIGFR